MSEKTDARRADLRERLILAAERQIREGGLPALKARNVTAEAGCALGALYTVVEDLDELVMRVNARTLARLGQALALAAQDRHDPESVLHALAQTYVTFALNDQPLWTALFDHRLPVGARIPDWHVEDHAVLIQEIMGPLAELQPNLAPESLLMRARSVFAAVHGVVQLATDGRFVGVPRAQLASEVEALVGLLVAGSRAQSMAQSPST